MPINQNWKSERQLHEAREQQNRNENPNWGFTFRFLWNAFFEGSKAVISDFRNPSAVNHNIVAVQGTVRIQRTFSQIMQPLLRA